MSHCLRVGLGTVFFVFFRCVRLGLAVGLSELCSCSSFLCMRVVEQTAMSNLCLFLPYIETQIFVFRTSSR